MDLQDFMRISLPLTLFAVGAALLLWFWPWPVTPFLDKKRRKAQIIDIVELSHDTKRFRLSLGSSNAVLGLPVGKHITLFAPNPAKDTWNGKPDPDKGKPEIERKYTPVTGNETLGYVDLVIKVYKPGTVRMPDGKEMNWEDGGKMGLFLDSRKVGDSIDILGPIGVNEYLGKGMFKLPGRTLSVKNICMMAGGTGLTPMLQVAKAALRDAGDKSKFSLIYANKTEDDILCRDMLDELAEKHKDRFKLTYTLDFPPRGWEHKQGFITTDMIKEAFAPPSPDTIVLMCGPPPMIEFACKKNLEALGYPKTSMAAF